MIRTKSFIKSSRRRYEALNEMLYMARVARGVSQAVVAGELGCAQTQISRVERGSDVPDVVEYLEWCRVLELDPVKTLKKLLEVPG